MDPGSGAEVTSRSGRWSLWEPTPVGDGFFGAYATPNRPRGGLPHETAIAHGVGSYKEATRGWFKLLVAFALAQHTCHPGLYPG